MKIRIPHITISLLLIAATITLLYFLDSCQNNKDNEDPPFVNRVVLIYMDEDDKASSKIDEQIESIIHSWQADEDDRVIIYANASDNIPMLYELSQKDGENIKRLLFKYDENSTTIRADFFSHVLNDVKTLYSPTSYGLIMYSHTLGWTPKQGLAEIQPAAATDNDRIELRELAATIPDNTFDFIIFGAPYMADIEVAYELKDKTDYILASSAEIVSPDIALVYSKFISYLFEPTANLKGFASKVFDHISSSEEYSNSVTLSIISTSKLTNLSNWLESNIMPRTYDINEIQHFDRFSDHLFFDFEDYYGKLLLSDEQRQTLAELTSLCVIYKKATPSFMITDNGFEIKRYSGLTSYIPSNDHPTLNNEYKKLMWGKTVSLDK